MRIIFNTKVEKSRKQKIRIIFNQKIEVQKTLLQNVKIRRKKHSKDGNYFLSNFLDFAHILWSYSEHTSELKV